MADRLQAMFYSQEELQALQRNTRADVKLLRRRRKKERRTRAGDYGDESPLSKSEQLALNDTPIRGIEQFVSKGSWDVRREAQLAVIHAVLNEQDHLRTNGGDLSDFGLGRIASASSTLSLGARRQAVTLGLQDADDAG